MDKTYAHPMDRLRRNEGKKKIFNIYLGLGEVSEDKSATVGPFGSLSNIFTYVIEYGLSNCGVSENRKSI